MSTPAVVIIFLLCQFDVSSQSCEECECCYGDMSSACDTDKKCINGCIEGFYGDKCVEPCRNNCRTCTDEQTCTECHPGFSGAQCALACGKGCVNNTCLQSGKCSCKSANFVDEWCMSCIARKHGIDCDNSCPRRCGSCLSDIQCNWCRYKRNYGSYCQFRCSIGCHNRECQKGDGSCACKTGFTGTKCDSCVLGKHGPSCDLDCPGNCKVCLSNSHCTECKPGYFGSICTNVCKPGCNKSKCDIDGICTQGCYPGFNTTVNCEKCETGMWGDLCQNKCPENCLSSFCKYDCQFNCSSSCLDRKCSKMDGHCFSCSKGLDGNFCRYNTTMKKCIEGFYGNDCEYKCEDIDGSCLSCLTDQSAGFGGCIECSSGYYPLSSPGQNYGICTQCPEGCVNDTCDAKNGVCVHGCWTYYTYGNYCEKNCSKTCKDERCDWKTGHCAEGCEKNHYGAFCENECKRTCKSDENESRCNESNGNCNSCVDGYHGDMCERRCSDYCVNATCNKHTAECLNGCSQGYKGSQCIQAIKGPGSEGINLALTLGASVGGGIALFVVVVVIVVCISRRKRRKHAHANANSRVSGSLQSINADVVDKSNERYVDDVGAAAVIYAQPDKPPKKSKELANEMYDTTFSNKNMKKSKSDNEYDVFVPRGHTDNDKRKRTVDEAENATYDTTTDNKNKNMFQLDTNYAELSTGRGTLPETDKGKPREADEEMYDTAYDNKSKKMFKPDNDYGVLNTCTEKFPDKDKCKLNAKNEEATNDMYDTAYKDKNKKSFKPDNDYAVLSTGSKK